MDLVRHRVSVGTDRRRLRLVRGDTAQDRKNARGLDLGRVIRRTLLGVLISWCLFAYAYCFVTGSPSDLVGYLAGARQFLETGTPYTIPAEPLSFDQMLAIHPYPFVHPPIALYLFVPFLWLPAVIWWLIPAGIFARCAYRWRPGEWAWIASLAILGWPSYVQNIQVGNTDMWIAALTGAGILYGWPAALLVLKPQALPWAVFSIRHRSFWIGLGVIAMLAVPFGALWFEWIEMVSKVTSAGPFYIIKLLPAVPVIWWLSWRRRSVAKEHAQDADDRGHVVEEHPVAGVLREGDEVRL